MTYERMASWDTRRGISDSGVRLLESRVTTKSSLREIQVLPRPKIGSLPH